jgi:hypothetical protein
MTTRIRPPISPTPTWTTRLYEIAGLRVTIPLSGPRGWSVEYSGTYEDCKGGTYSFGGHGERPVGLSRTVPRDPMALAVAVAGQPVENSQIVRQQLLLRRYWWHGQRDLSRLPAGTYSFGGNNGGIASGTFTNVSGSGGSFGGAGARPVENSQIVREGSPSLAVKARPAELSSIVPAKESPLVAKARPAAPS